MPRCRYKHKKHGRCIQPADVRLCPAHERWAADGVTPDDRYNAKIIAGLLQPTWDYLSESEANALLNGRYRGDGRRLDQFVSAEPMMIDPEAFHR